MPDITEKCAVELRWSKVGDIVSDETEEILGLRIRCVAEIEMSDYWDILFEDYRLPVSKLCQLLQAVQMVPEEWEEVLPQEGEAEIWDIGMTLSEKLLGRHLGFTWEHSLITEDSLWLVGISEPTKTMDEGSVCAVISELVQAITNIANCLHRLENTIQMNHWNHQNQKAGMPVGYREEDNHAYCSSGTGQKTGSS